MTSRTAYLDEIPQLKDYRLVSNPMRNQYAMYTDSRPLNPEAASWYRTHSGTLNYYASAIRYDIALVRHFAAEAVKHSSN